MNLATKCFHVLQQFSALAG